MEFILLAQTAIALATPFLTKSGEKIAENIGEEIWKFINKPFNSEKDEFLTKQVEEDTDVQSLEIRLIEKLHQNSEFAYNLKNIVENAQKELRENMQQINNNAVIEKQINIQNNSGSIQM
ncbi:hypothetical protein [Flavobacterium eburneipallidum]|uniref:hypothetical protein n=1 Tax=Flavobacterium eburneipallidum TaxID=3003263 RepID=UPI0022AC29AE|nr:hypothetical protein [Flavobacterium eburneipallidum]